MNALFDVKKPIIALLHLSALPGDPYYNRENGMDRIIELARTDLHNLQNGGVDGILIANEFSFPYQKKTSMVTVAAMARIIGELKREIKVPFGVNVVLDPAASIELAAATGAYFIRSVFTGTYVGDLGLRDTDIATVIRRKVELGLDIKMYYMVNSESDVPVNDRDVQKVTKSIIFKCAPDGLCVAGESAGQQADIDEIKLVRKVSGDVPVFCNTGCTKDNVVQMLSISDGAFVGTGFKIDGKFKNQTDAKVIKEFMDIVREYRKSL